MTASSIEWTEETWNPVRGCDKVSPGCKHCYAATFAERFRGVPAHPYEHGFDLRLVPGKLAEPFRWPTPRTVFVNSMSDLLHESVPDSYVAAVIRVMTATPWHTYQVLTKRPERLSRVLHGGGGAAPNIWWGVSVENRKHGLRRIPLLREAPATTRFLSIEPLLERLGPFSLEGIHWVIVGGESGHGARPMEESWVHDLLEQCTGAGVPFFFKQWGGVQKKRNGRHLNGRTYDDMPAKAASPIAPLAKRRAAEAATLLLASHFSGEPIPRSIPAQELVTA